MADILGIDKQALANAFEQAKQEMWDEAFINRVNQAAAEGLITQEQADEIIEWWEQRPEDALSEWWGQRPGFMERGMLRYNFNLRLQDSPGSSRLHIQNKIQNRLSEASCQKLSW